ncbi:MAG: RNA 2',3'-cyclic phosphodiesterase [Thermoplasmata archaeon]
MRVFVAVDLEPTAPPKPPDRPVAAPPHLTLRFLGEVGDDRLPPISDALAGAARGQPPFDVTLDGVGAFPSRNDPRVVWVGATAGREALVALAGRISDRLAAIGVPPDARGFFPHVTLFRVRSATDRQWARRLLAGTDPGPPALRVRVAEVALKESHRSPDGPVHRTLATFPLSATVPPDSPDSDAARPVTSFLQR